MVAIYKQNDSQKGDSQVARDLAFAFGLGLGPSAKMERKLSTRVVGDDEKVFIWKSNTKFLTSDFVSYHSANDIARLTNLALWKVKEQLRAGDINTATGSYSCLIRTEWEFAEEN